MSQVSMFKHHIQHTITVLKDKHLTTPLKADILKDQANELHISQPEISQFLDDLQNYITELFNQNAPARHEHYKMFIEGLTILYKITKRFPEKENMKERLEIFTQFFMLRFDHIPAGQEILFTLAQYMERI